LHRISGRAAPHRRHVRRRRSHGLPEERVMIRLGFDRPAHHPGSPPVHAARDAAGALGVVGTVRHTLVRTCPPRVWGSSPLAAHPDVRDAGDASRRHGKTDPLSVWPVTPLVARSPGGNGLNGSRKGSASALSTSGCWMGGTRPTSTGARGGYQVPTSPDSTTRTPPHRPTVQPSQPPPLSRGQSRERTG
jgi:hypothetical protein